MQPVMVGLDSQGGLVVCRVFIVELEPHACRWEKSDIMYISGVASFDPREKNICELNALFFVKSMWTTAPFFFAQLIDCWR